jgi:hypothetical protein
MRINFYQPAGLWFFLSFAGYACAGPVDPVLFEERVRLAKAAQDDESYRVYPHALFRQAGRHVARTMRSCIAASPKPKSKVFTLVADMTAQGKADAVEVMPDSAAARCFAAGFSSATYPVPPAYAGRDGFPVTLRVRVAH